jgi:hypothetical protein
VNVEQAPRLVESSLPARNAASQSGEAALDEDRSRLELKRRRAAMGQAYSSE